MIALNDVAFQNGELLDILSDPEASRATSDLADRLGRDRSNLRRSLKSLTDAGLIADGHLTDDGAAQLSAWRRAKGLDAGPSAPASAEAQRWPIDAIRPNPANRKVSLDGIADLAASIIGAGDVLQPLILTPPDADGVRMILAGERRWRAVRQIMNQDVEAHNENVLEGEPVFFNPDLPPALDQGVPFVEREATAAEALQITIIENSQREDLTPWQDAQLLYQLHLATGWSGAELARNIGRVEEGSRSGLRDVQTKLKIAREATPEAIAAYEADGSWDRLRDSVTKPKGPDNIHLALFLAEAALRSDDEEGVWDGLLIIQPGLEWPEGWAARWFDYGPDTGRLTLRAAATDWLGAEGLGEDPDALLKCLRAKTGITDRPEPRPWVSACLNWTPDQDEPEAASDADPGADDPLMVNGVRYPNATRAAEARRLAEGQRIHIASPTREPVADADAADQILAPLDREDDAMPDLSPRQRLALIELAHKISMSPRSAPGGDFGAPVGSYWLASTANDLKQMHLARFVSVPGGEPPLGVLTDRGRDWLRSVGLWLKTLPDIVGLDITSAQEAVGAVTWPDAYATDWIANEAKPAADLAADASPAPVQTDVEDAADEAARAAAADTLLRAQAFIARDGAAQPFARHELARLLDECRASGGLQSDGNGTILNADNEAFLQFDPNGELPDDLARAGAALLVHIVNTARTRHHDEAPNPWPARAPEGETLHARLLRTGEAVRNLMVIHYDDLKPDPASEAAYAEFSSALNALRRHELAQAMGSGKGEAA